MNKNIQNSGIITLNVELIEKIHNGNEFHLNELEILVSLLANTKNWYL